MNVYNEWVTDLPPTPGRENTVDAALELDGENRAARAGQVYISEIMAHPVDQKNDWVELYNDSGEDVQICNFYPYTTAFSLAGTVNAQLIFGVLEPGSYTYVVSAIAENESYSSGSVVLIEHGFQIYYD